MMEASIASEERMLVSTTSTVYPGTIGRGAELLKVHVGHEREGDESVERKMLCHIWRTVLGYVDIFVVPIDANMLAKPFCNGNK